MIRFVVALDFEADALVRRYRMEPCEGAFSWFRSEEAALVISGVGKIAAAAATSYLHARTGEEPLGVWLNFGTAGHRDRPPGDVLLAHTVTDAASGARFHPTRLDGPDLEAVEVRTVGRAETEFDSEAVYDMEAYAFMGIGLRFSTSELVQSIKIVSDNRETTIAAWTPAAVRALVEDRVDVVARAADRFLEIANDLEPVRREERESRALVESYRSRAHFTTSEARRLRRLLQRWAALEPEAPRGWENAGGTSATEVLDRLERRLQELGASIRELPV
jgi:adenosylhomocysteine nucleosidase